MINQTYHSVGIIGFGVRGQSIAETFINVLPEYGHIAAVADCRENMIFSAYISTRCQDLKVYKDYNDLLADKTIDSVIVTTYPESHLEITKAALLAGKAVLCDKPIVSSLAEAEELYKFLKNRRCKFQIGLNLPNFAVPLKLKELLDRQEIGRITYVRGMCDVGCEFGRRIILNKFAGDKGGLILGKLTHDTDLMQYLLGTYAEEVWGMGANFLWKRHNGEGSDDTCAIAGVMNNGTLFTQSLTSTGATYGRYFHFFGTEGELYADLHSDTIRLTRPSGQTSTISAIPEKSGGHGGADATLFSKFLDYVDSDEEYATTPERILSSVMIPFAAISGTLVKTGEWYRSITANEKQ